MELKHAPHPGRRSLIHVPMGEESGPAWVAERHDELLAEVERHGAVVIRGLGLRTPTDVERIGRLLLGRRMVEREAFARRRVHAEGVYSSSEWPPDEPICMHHELSYALDVPRLLLFGCLRASPAGGATGVADSHAVLEALPSRLVERFERTGWTLTRTYGGVGMTWPEAFGTADRDAVAEYCRRHAIDHTWGPGDVLRTRQRRAAVVRHPRSGRPGWFNQVAFLNEWTLDPAIRAYLVDTYGIEGLPYTTSYGDGEPIEPEAVRTIAAVYEALTAREPWRDGDVLLVDNVRMAHGRDPFTGSRDVVVMMGEPVRLAGHAASD